MSAEDKTDPWHEFRDLPPLLTPAEVAGVLRVSVKTVYNRRALGKLPGVVVDPQGAGFLVRKRDLLRSLQVQTSATR